MNSLTFTVYGVPQPQGSIKAFMPKGCTRPILTSDNAKLKPWRQQITGTALAAVEPQKFCKITRPFAVELHLAFFFDKPKSVRAADKTTKPDLDKLERGVCDALTGVAYDDDSQVTRVTKSKDFGSPARTEIFVTNAEQRAVKPTGGQGSTSAL